MPPDTAPPSESDPVTVTAAFIHVDLAAAAAGIHPALLRQWVWRQWHGKGHANWSIAVACDLTTRRVVYSLADVMRTEAATRQSPKTRTVRDNYPAVA